MSFALVENIPLYDVITKSGSRYKPELKACTSVCIMFSIFVFGGGTYYLLKFLGVKNSTSRETESELGLRETESASMDDYAELLTPNDRDEEVGRRSASSFSNRRETKKSDEDLLPSSISRKGALKFSFDRETSV